MMKRSSRWTTWPGSGRVALIAGLAAAMFAPPAIAQQGSRAKDCHCVDSKGDPIPSCTCLQVPSPDRILSTVMADQTRRAHLGIMVDPGQDASVDAKGVEVQSVFSGGPADQAGIRAGDIITSVAGKSLLQPLPHEKTLESDQSAPVQRLMEVSRGLRPGQKVEVGFLRDGTPHEVTLEIRDLSGPFTLDLSRDSVLRSHMHELRERMRGLADSLRGIGDSLRVVGPRLRGLHLGMVDSMPGIRVWMDSLGHGGVLLRDWSPDSTVRAFAFRVRPGHHDRCPGESGSGMVGMFGDDCVGGLQLVSLNPGLASYFKTDKGVLVANVLKGSPLGLQPGDVILRIGARDATSPDEVRRILRSYTPKESITFHIERKGRTMDVSGHLGGS